jgi:hypothetical protein
VCGGGGVGGGAHIFLAKDGRLKFPGHIILRASSFQPSHLNKNVAIFFKQKIELAFFERAVPTFIRRRKKVGRVRLL